MKAIVTAQGFQESNRRRSGTEDGYFQITRKYLGPFVIGGLPIEWTADVKSIARQLSRQGVKEIACISYSHGQAAIVDFAKEIARINDEWGAGITIPLWLACDPVLRADWLPRRKWLQIFSIRSMCQRGTIKVPRIIERVASVRQNLTRPNGHDFKRTGSRQEIVKPMFLRYSHTAIDSAPEWYELMDHELAKFTEA